MVAEDGGKNMRLEFRRPGSKFQLCHLVDNADSEPQIVSAFMAVKPGKMISPFRMALKTQGNSSGKLFYPHRPG